MTPLVPDISVLLGQVLEEDDARLSESVFIAIAERGAVVPSLFWYEIRNALLVNERRGRIRTEHTALFLAALADLPFDEESPQPDSGVMDLARRHGLTVYDAAYLELALRRGLELATTDHQLSRAAKASGVSLWTQG